MAAAAGASMNAPRFLMCPPEHYEIVYEINPWMSVQKKADIALARRQWQDYYELLTSRLGASIELIDPVAGLPDMVFTANAGLVSGLKFVRSSFRHRERRGEEPYFEKWFRKKGYRIFAVDKPFCFEGEGDALSMNGELFMGYHFRSDLEALDIVSGHAGSPYTPLELALNHYYHLDTCFAPLDDRSALVFLDAFAPYSQLALIEMVPDLIRVPEEEARGFACNAVVMGKNIVIPEGCPGTREALEKRGFHVYALNFSEFIKAGGAAKCLVLKL